MAMNFEMICPATASLVTLNYLPFILYLLDMCPKHKVITEHSTKSNLKSILPIFTDLSFPHHDYP